MKPKFASVIASITQDDTDAWSIINRCARAPKRSGLVGSVDQMRFVNQCIAAGDDRSAVLRVAKRWFEVAS